MTIEKDIHKIAEAITRLVDHIVEREESPQGELTDQPEPTGEVPQLAVPRQPEQPEVQPQVAVPEEPMAQEPTLQAVPDTGVTKKVLWDELQATYAVLQTVKRGEEIGKLLSQYKAAHLDQLDPKDYVTVHRTLLQLKASVQGVGNG